MTENYDYIVIGSGFGGSVAAYKLIESGARVLLIERGPWRDTDPVRAMGVRDISPLPKGRHFYSHSLRTFSAPITGKRGMTLNSRGLFECLYSKDMSIVCSSGVGGGSHVYSAMNVRPEVDNYWSKYIGKKNAAELDKNYTWMIDQMGATSPTKSDSIPNFIGDQMEGSPHFIADDSISQPAMSVQKTGGGNYKSNSFFGSQNGAKATLDDVLLKPALAKGLEVLPLHECVDIQKIESEVQTGYRLECYDHKKKTYRFFSCSKVMLAAGTLNTAKLLFKSRDSGGLTGMPALGKGLGGNGDFPAYWNVNTSQADYTQGLPCHGRFELRNFPNSPNMTAYGLNGLDDIPLPRAVKAPLRRSLVLVGMGADNADGMFTWHKGKLGTRYISENNPIIARVDHTFDEIEKRSKAKVWRTKSRLVTVHPLGGARLGKEAHSSVVDVNGEVHDNRGLYVVDASALPAAPGAPPSMTISAWSAYVTDKLISKSK